MLASQPRSFAASCVERAGRAHPSTAMEQGMITIFFAPLASDVLTGTGLVVGVCGAVAAATSAVTLAANAAEAAESVCDVWLDCCADPQAVVSSVRQASRATAALPVGGFSVETCWGLSE